MYIPIQENCAEKERHSYSPVETHLPQGYPTPHKDVSYAAPQQHNGLECYHSGVEQSAILHIVECHYVDFMFMTLFIGVSVYIWKSTRFVKVLRKTFKVQLHRQHCMNRDRSRRIQNFGSIWRVHKIDLYISIFKIFIYVSIVIYHIFDAIPTFKE